MAIISADKYIMGDYRSGRVSKVLLWATVGVVAALTGDRHVLGDILRRAGVPLRGQVQDGAQSIIC